MPTPKKGARLGGSAKQQAHMLSNLAASLIEHGAIKTTDAKAKVLRPYIEKIITRKDVVSYLFDEVAPKFENREGGYTRTIKLDNRTGDNAPMSQISLVLEETVTSEANRATRAAASKAAEAEEAKADEAAETEAPAEETAAEESEEK